MGVDYRALARQMVAYRAARPSRFTLSCAGCGKQLSRDSGGAWYADARRALAREALEEGWDLDGEGRIGCKSCMKKLVGE